MKRFLAILLTCVMLCSAVIAEGMISADAKTKTSLYKTKVSSICKNATGNSDFSYEKGFLYDFDGNGVKELVLTYQKKIDGFPYLVCSVYTIKNNKVVTLVKQKKLFAMAGGPSAAVGVAKKNGKSYLFCYDETGETGGSFGLTRYGELIYSKISGTKIKTCVKMKFKIKGMDKKVQKSTITSNGKKISYSKFIKYQEGFKYSYVKRNDGWTWKYYYNSAGLGLKALWKKL